MFSCASTKIGYMLESRWMFLEVERASHVPSAGWIRPCWKYKLEISQVLRGHPSFTLRTWLSECSFLCRWFKKGGGADMMTKWGCVHDWIGCWLTNPRRLYKKRERGTWNILFLLKQCQKLSTIILWLEVVRVVLLLPDVRVVFTVRRSLWSKSSRG